MKKIKFIILISILSITVQSCQLLKKDLNLKKKIAQMNF